MPPRRGDSGVPAGARVVTGTPEPAPLPVDALTPLPMDALQPVEPAPLPMDALQPAEPEIELIPGFEGTMLEERAPRSTKPAPSKKAEAPGFQYDACPSCSAPQPKPNPVLCESCGTRLMRKRRSEDDRVKRCTECGTKNAPDRSLCLNCGVRLLDLDD